MDKQELIGYVLIHINLLGEKGLAWTTKNGPSADLYPTREDALADGCSHCVVGEVYV